MFTPIISGISFCDILVYFLLYSIVGYMLEVVYAALVLGKFVNRGFLNGPWCPIYGFGMVIVAITLRPVSQNLFMLFIGSFIVTSVIEFVTGFVLEKVFNQKWWDYSDEPFNLGGYICLKFSLIWGIACVFVVRLVLPFTDWLASHLHNTIGAIVLFTLLGLMIADLAATVVTIVGIRKKLRLMTAIAEKLKANSDSVGGFLSEETLELRSKFDALSASISEKRGSRRVMNAFPNLKEKSANKLAELRESFHEEVEKSRDNFSEARESFERRVDAIRPKLAITKEDIPHIVIALIIGIALGYFIGKIL